MVGKILACSWIAGLVLVIVWSVLAEFASLAGQAYAEIQCSDWWDRR